MKYIFFLQCT